MKLDPDQMSAVSGSYVGRSKQNRAKSVTSSQRRLVQASGAKVYQPVAYRQHVAKSILGQRRGLENPELTKEQRFNEELNQFKIRPQTASRKSRDDLSSKHAIPQKDKLSKTSKNALLGQIQGQQTDDDYKSKLTQENLERLDDF